MKKLKIIVPTGYAILGFDLKTGEVLLTEATPEFIKIRKGTGWYHDKIGEVYKVFEYNNIEDRFYTKEDKSYWVNARDCESANKPDYIITSFRSTHVNSKETIFIFENGLYTLKGGNSRNKYSLHQMMNDGCCVMNGYYMINSVKRSDDIEFKIGDKTQCGTISKFEIQDSMIRVWFEGNPSKYNMNLDSLRHATPIYTTQDGVELFDRSEEVVGILKSTLKIVNNGNSIGTWLNGWYTKQWVGEPYRDSDVLKALEDNFVLFKSQVAANDYIMMNRPSLSINDVINSLTGSEWQKEITIKALKSKIS